MNVQSKDTALEDTAHYSGPASLHQGYDSVTGAGRSTSIIGESVENGAATTLKCTVCTSIQDLAQALEINESLSAAYGPLGSADQKLDFVRNLDVTTSSISVVVYCRHVARIQTLQNQQLDPSVPAPTDAKSIAAFFNAYGDSFLSSVTYGGEYYAVYTFYANDSQQQSSIKANLQASGIFSGVSVDSRFQAQFDQVIISATTRTNFSQSVSGIQNPLLPQIENIVDYAIKFPSIPLDMQAVIEFGIMGYENVIGLNIMKVLVTNRKYFNGSTTQPGLAAKLGSLVALRNKIEDLAGTYATYGATLDPKLTLVRSEVNDDIDAICNQIEGWEDDPTQVFPAISLDSLKQGTPILSISVNAFGPFGGSGGGLFDDINPSPLEFICSRTQLVSISLYGGKYVDRLTADYMCEGKTSTFNHGGEGGGYAGTLSISVSNPITGVSGDSGNVVDKLTISGSTVLSVGGSGGGSFQSNIPANNFLLGFRGRSGKYLDQIIIIYAGFNPVIWQQA